jgi:choline kinase
MTSPQVFILAAGLGSRLGDLTADVPKVLLPVDGVPIVDRQLDALASCGVADSAIHIVTGYAADTIRARFGDRFDLVHNPLWDVHNNIVTVHRLQAQAPDDLLIINGDTLFAPGILTSLLDADGDAVLAVDDGGELAEEQMKVTFEDGRMTRIGKDLDPASSDGEYIGLLHFRGAALAAFHAELGRMIDEGRTDDWYEGGLNGICDQVAITAASTHGLPWIEVDTPEDLAAAADIVRAMDSKAGS